MRKPFLDNLRYIIVLLVIFYHIFYLFNSVGVITNVAIPGIPAADVVEYLLYPWFMVALFVISGICARYSLEAMDVRNAGCFAESGTLFGMQQRQTHRQFLKTKVRRQLLPSIAGIFLIGWSNGWVTNQYTDMFMGNGAALPGFVKYLIYCMCGIGVLWFLHQLFLAELVLVLVRRLDRKDRLYRLGGKVTFPVLCLMMFALWGSAQILNTPVIEVYRNGIYIFAFLVGYFVFSHDHVQEISAKYAPVLLAVSGILAVVYTVTYWGENYTTMANLKSLLTNAYSWFAVLAVLGAGKRWLDRETKFTGYMAGRSFGFYVLHYPVLALGAYVLDQWLHFPGWAMYLILPVVAVIVLPCLVGVVKRVPVLRLLLLGESRHHS